MLYFFLCILLYFLLFAVSRENIKFLFLILRNKKLAFWVISILFFPGTVIHELSHFLTALLLFLRVKDIEIFPNFEKGSLKLGRVIYEKKDFFRSFLVGVSPLFFGTFVLYIIFYFKLFPSKDLFINIFWGYLIFSISSTMFSSKRDLQDAKYLIPLFLFLMMCIYLFDLQIWNYFVFFDKYEIIFYKIFKVLIFVFLIQFLVWMIFSVIYKLREKNVTFPTS